MLGLGIAASNVPQLYRPGNTWQTIYDQWTTEGIPPPNELAQETDEVVEQYVKRINAGFDTLHQQLAAYRPDIVVMLGYDDGTCFTGIQVPQLCTYTGPEMKGSAAITLLGEKPEDHEVTLKCNPEFAWEVHRALVDREFDMSYMAVQHPVGRPEMGTSSAFTRPWARLLQDLNVAVLPIFINCHVEPTLTAHRIHPFGQALGEILEEMPGRVALFAIGGLSHDPNGDRAGWIDDRLDRWVLDRLSKGDSARLKTLFDVDSDTVRGGTAQIRTWIATGAAMERVYEERGLSRTITTASGQRQRSAQMTVVDYIPALRAMTGIAFAYYNLG